MVCFAEVTHFDTVVAFVLPDQEFLFQRIQVFRHKDELPSGRILTFMILHGQAFFYPSVSTFIIASHRVFLFRVCKDPFNGFFALRINLSAQLSGIDLCRFRNLFLLILLLVGTGLDMGAVNENCVRM